MALSYTPDENRTTGWQRTLRATRGPMDLIIDGTTDTAALADPTATNTKPSGTGVVIVDGFQAARFVFGGTTTTNNEINYQIIGWQWATNGATESWIPTVLAKGLVMLGADVYAATALNIGAAANLWADTITDRIKREGTLIFAPRDDTRAMLEVLADNCDLIQVEIDRIDATTVDVFCQLCEPTRQGAPYVETRDTIDSPLVLIIDGSVAGGALVDATATNTKPVGTGIVDCFGHEVARLTFGGVGADGNQYNYQIIGWYRARTLVGTESWVPMMLASGVATFGTDVYGAALNIGAATNFWADTVTDTISREGTLVYSPANDTRVLVEVPLMNCSVVQVQTDITTATSADVFLQLGNASPDRA